MTESKVTDEMVERARNAYNRISNLNDECEDDTVAWRYALQAALAACTPAKSED